MESYNHANLKIEFSTDINVVKKETSGDEIQLMIRKTQQFPRNEKKLREANEISKSMEQAT